MKFFTFLFLVLFYLSSTEIKISSTDWKSVSLFHYSSYQEKNSSLNSLIFQQKINFNWNELNQNFSNQNDKFKKIQKNSISFFTKLDITEKIEENNKELMINLWKISLQFGNYFFSQQIIKFYFNIDYEYFDNEKSSYWNNGVGAKYNFIKSQDILQDLSVSFILFLPIKWKQQGQQQIYLAKESFFHNPIYSFRPKLELNIDKWTLSMIYFFKFYQKENKISNEWIIASKLKIKKLFSFLTSFSIFQYDIINDFNTRNINLHFGLEFKNL